MTKVSEASRQAVAQVLPKAEKEAAYVCLKVQVQLGTVVSFRITKSTPLGKLMDVVCSRLGLQAPHVRFMVGAVPIAPSDTAGALGLEDGDLVVVKAFLPPVDEDGEEEDPDDEGGMFS